MVGDGDEIPHLKKRVVKEKLSDCCIFTGYISREDLACVYSIATVFVFPSRNETQGLVTLEAFASGLPVVAMGCMGTCTVMKGNKRNHGCVGGFMLDPLPHDAPKGAETREFAGAVCRLLGRVGTRTTLVLEDDIAQACRERAKATGQHFGQVVSQMVRAGFASEARPAGRFGTDSELAALGIEVFPGANALVTNADVQRIKQEIGY
jgi:glycosyltransferase involved in cell wall biosynthesis